MNKESLEKIRKLTKDKITVSNFQKDQNMNNKRISMKKISAIACICLVLTGSIVFAKDIEKFVREKFNFGLGDGVDSAAENGYIAEPEMEKVESETKVETQKNDLGTIVDNINTSVKIDSFLMDDYNLSVEFNIEFEEKIKNLINFESSYDIEFSDLIVLDEEKRIIFIAPLIGEEKFYSLCNKHNLNQKFGEFNENYMNNGLNRFIQNINKESNTINYIYNMYTDDKYPKSKKLDFYFTEITIYNENYDPINNSNDKYIFKGNWEMHFDVPEKMYNRSEEHYRVISCENDKFNIYAAKVMDTGFELGIMISDIVKPEYPTELIKKQIEISNKYNNVIDQTGASKEWEEFLQDGNNEKVWNEYHTKSSPISINGTNLFLVGEAKNKKTEGCYVLNSNGEKFKSTMSPSRKANNNFVQGNKFDFYETFGMTKYDATDKITVIIDFYGEPVKIELEKIK